MSKPSICVITCYKQPDYVRAKTLRRGLHESDLFEDVLIVKNKHTGVLRYIDVFAQLIKIRFSKNPDFYILTFRGYETLPFVWLMTLGKKLLYDEFINPVEWFVYEHKKFAPGSIPAKLLRAVFRWFGKRVSLILTDTESHADYSAELMDLPREKYRAIPVGTDERTFQPLNPISHDGFRVLFYGNMLPLHGVDIVLKTAEILAARTDIIFHFVGGKKVIREKTAAAQAIGANIEHDKWIEFEKLPETFAKSDICLGGPFGGTVQSQYVITGKTFQFMAAARPAVIGSNKETQLFTDKQNALVVPQANVDALKDVILWAAENRDKLEAIGQNGRKLYEEQFSSKRIACDFTSLFREYGITNVES